MSEPEQPNPTDLPEPPPWRAERKSVVRSFRYAWDGVLFVFMTQRHMRVHAAIIALVLFAAWGLAVNELELLHLMVAMALVIIAEMVNTSVETVVDMIVDSYNPQAKIVKDVAAGAVLVASAYAMVVAWIIFFNNPRLREIIATSPYPPHPDRAGALVLVILGIIAIGLFIGHLKYRTRRGTFWRGGIVSGHTALGFLLATAIAIMTRDLSVIALALALAILISQSRLQARIHSPIEIVLGALMGTIIALLLFLWPAGYWIP
ncbi:MAG TPA: diacylglycerol kinase [Armatimonadota bacterium]|jgi:diacylglycerol kinase (ATP)